MIKKNENEVWNNYDNERAEKEVDRRMKIKSEKNAKWWLFRGEEWQYRFRKFKKKTKKIIVSQNSHKIMN